MMVPIQQSGIKDCNIIVSLLKRLRFKVSDDEKNGGYLQDDYDRPSDKKAKGFFSICAIVELPFL